MRSDEVAYTMRGSSFADFIPLNVGAMYSVSEKLSVGGALTWADLKENADTLNLALAARFAL